MLKTLKIIFKINITLKTNIFIYNLKQLPFFKDLITNEIYSSKFIKKLIEIFILIFAFFKSLFLKYSYFIFIYLIAYYFFPKNFNQSFIHLILIYILLNSFFNNKLLNNNREKYYNISIFKIDANIYIKNNLILSLLYELFLNSIILLSFNKILNNLKLIFAFIILLFSSKIVGETLNIIIFKKKRYFLSSNRILNILLFLITLILYSLQFYSIFITPKYIYIITIIIALLSSFLLIFLLKKKDYLIIYEYINKVTNLNDNKNEKEYLRQILTNDKQKSNLQLRKKGYTLFNTIFFKRHNKILLSNVKKYSLLLFIIYLILGMFILKNQKFSIFINNFLIFRFSWFILIMFFINRGVTITKAIFYNCDHAMLKYNFYKEPLVILNLFIRRMITSILINLIPALIIATGNSFLLILSKKYNLLILSCNFLSILLLNIFFSTHYLVIYYLLQPFNKNIEVKNINYSIIITITYFFIFIIKDYVIDSFLLFLIILFTTIIYLIISLILVFKLSPKTFRVKD